MISSMNMLLFIILKNRRNKKYYYPFFYRKDIIETNVKKRGIFMQKRMRYITLIFFICIGLLGCQKEAVLSETEFSNIVVKEVQEMTPEEKKEAFLNEKISNMTLEQKAGQVLFCAFRRDENNVPITTYNEALKATLQQYHIGGVVLFGENIDTKEQTKQLIEEIRNSSEIPIFIGIDEEGGSVSRLHFSGKLDVADIPSAEEIGNTNDTTVAYQAGKTIAQELKELGFDVDFAPVADIRENAENTVIGNRAFSNDPQKAADMAVAFSQGLQQEGISAAAKHFPGHGNTIEDSHEGMAVSKDTLEEMEQKQWIPFQKVIENDIDFIMAGHINTPNATTDGLPASLSYQMLTEQLRNHLGFEGIIITDALDMAAVTKYENAPLMAIQAGADMALMPVDIEKAHTDILTALKQGTLSEDTLNEKVKRILSLKYDKGYFQKEL